MNNNIPNNEIWYTSTDGDIITNYNSHAFGDNGVISNTYNGSKGVIKFSKDITSIGDYAFNCCYEITSITIPNGSHLISIGSFAFGGCKNLISITILNNVTSIGNFAFGGCEKLTYINIPNSVTKIGIGLFENCPDLKMIHCSNRNIIRPIMKYYRHISFCIGYIDSMGYINKNGKVLEEISNKKKK